MGEGRPIKDLLAERETVLGRIKKEKETLEAISAEIDAKLSGIFQTKRQESGKEYGVLTTQLDGHEVKQDIGKDVKWNQAELHKIAEKITKAKDVPERWMTKEWKVPESKFKAWPEDIQRVFLPARTVKPKTPKYDFKELKNDEKESAGQ